MRKLRILSLIITLLLIAAFSGKSQDLGSDPNIADTIYVDSIVSTSSTRGFVPVYFFNDEELAGIEMTLTYNSIDLFIDSFSFVDGRVESYTLKYADQLSPNTITCCCYALSEGLIPPGSGLLGYLFFSYLPGLQTQVVTIDTVTLTFGEKEHSTAFSDGYANMFKPEFVSGYLDIQPTNCCLGDRGNVNNSPDDQVDIDDMVYMVEYMFLGGPAPVCNEEANVEGSLDGSVDIDDIVYFVEYMFLNGPPPLSCP